MNSDPQRHSALTDPRFLFQLVAFISASFLSAIAAHYIQNSDVRSIRESQERHGEVLREIKAQFDRHQSNQATLDDKQNKQLFDLFVSIEGMKKDVGRLERDYFLLEDYTRKRIGHLPYGREP